jgi:hypothetical protein
MIRTCSPFVLTASLESGSSELGHVIQKSSMSQNVRILHLARQSADMGNLICTWSLHTHFGARHYRTIQLSGRCHIKEKVKERTLY